MENEQNTLAKLREAYSHIVQYERTIAALDNECTMTTRKLHRTQNERDRLRVSLAELVALKRLKDKYGKTETYVRQQPIAWQRAKEALHPSPSLIDERGKVDCDAVGCEDASTGQEVADA